MGLNHKDIVSMKKTFAKSKKCLVTMACEGTRSDLGIQGACSCGHYSGWLLVYVGSCKPIEDGRSSLFRVIFACGSITGVCSRRNFGL